MNASCLDEKGRFKSCPYRVYTDEQKVDELANVLHMVILDNPAVFAPVKEGQHENG